jgi:glyoxylase-like metal-dependent hydrolase (beta-lactamase superfamily II)
MNVSCVELSVETMTEGTRPIKLGYVNAYLVDAGDGYVLIDTGVPKQQARLERELAGAGCLPSKLRLVIITHGDVDHTGNGAMLQRKYGAKIAMHPADVDMVRIGPSAGRRSRHFLGRVLLWLGNTLSGKVERFQPDVLLEDGQSLVGYGLAAKVLHTPGHTRGSVVVLTDDGRLFAGDTLTNRTRPGRGPFVDCEEDLQRSLARLRQTGARVVYPGHGKPFSGDALASIA